MAIAFESRSAYEEGIGTAYGAAQARTQDRDYALRARAQAQDASQRAQALAQADDHFYSGQQNQNNRATAEMQNQANRQDDAQNHQAGMMREREQAEFTQADNQRLQRLNQDAAGWESLHQSGEITEQEFAQGQQMLRQGQQPLLARREAAQVQHLEKQNELLMQQEAMAAIRARLGNEYASANGPIFRDDPVSGQRFYQDSPGGNWRIVAPAGSETAGSRGADSTTSLLTGIDSEMRRETTRRDGDETPLPAWAASGASPELRSQERQRRLEERRTELMRQPGGPPVFQLPEGPPERWPAAASWTEEGQRRLQLGITAAQRGRQFDTEDKLRDVAVAIRSGKSTGQLTPEQQNELRGLGYYPGEFTPALDRELAGIERFYRQTEAGAEPGESAPAMRQAARTIRNLLGRYESMQRINADPQAARQFHGALAAIRVFKWGQNHDGSRRGDRDARARAAPPARTMTAADE